MKARTFIPLLVIAAGLLAYQNSFTGGFIHDDVGSIPQNPTIRHLWPMWQPLSPPHRGGLTVEGRPLINLSLAINYALGGYEVGGYHALNLTVHILAGLTLLDIVRRTLVQSALRERFGAAANELALATAVLWTVHPLQTESVTYIIQRAESIMGLFYLLTLYCFIRGVESPRPRLWHGLSVTACMLGMASKEVMVSAPLMVLSYDRAFLSGSFREAWRRRGPVYLALAGTWILLGFLAVSGGRFGYTSADAQRQGLTQWEYLATQPGVILSYLRLAVWPSPLTLEHAWPIARTWVRILPPAMVVASLLAAAAWAWKRNSVWGFVGAWFFLILAPSSSVIPFLDPLYEHRMYLSLAAVVSLAVMGLYSLMGRRSLAVFVVVAVGLGFRTWRYNQDYRGNALVTHYNLGVAYWGAGRIPEAISHYEQALRLNPDSGQAHYNLALALFQLGRVQEATEHWNQALRLKPDFAKSHNNLGAALIQLGKGPEAVEQFEQALRIQPDDAEAHNNLGAALIRLGKRQEAMEQFELALRIQPDDAEAHYNLGLALAGAGRVQEAIGHYEQALRIQPHYAEAHYNLGVALVLLGSVPEAVSHWEQALRIKPDYAEAHYNLGVALEHGGRVQEAIWHYEQAARLKPDFAEAQNNLAHLRAAQ